MLLVANEFLDALPIRQFVRGRRHWRSGWSRSIPRATSSLPTDPKAPRPSLLVPAALRRPRRQARSPKSARRPSRWRRRSARGWRANRAPRCSSITAIFRARRDRPFAPSRGTRPACCASPSPGRADLSAHVDFAAFAEAARAAGAETYGPVTQGRFLAALGIEQRLAALSGAPRRRSAAARKRCQALAGPGRNGTGLQSRGPGFAGFAAAGGLRSGCDHMVSQMHSDHLDAVPPLGFPKAGIHFCHVGVDGPRRHRCARMRSLRSSDRGAVRGKAYPSWYGHV